MLLGILQRCTSNEGRGCLSVGYDLLVVKEARQNLRKLQLGRFPLDPCIYCVFVCVALKSLEKINQTTKLISSNKEPFPLNQHVPELIFVPLESC